MNHYDQAAHQNRRLKLVPFSQAHAGDVEAFASLWEVARYTANIPHPYPPGGALAFARDAEQDRNNGQGGLVFAIALEDRMPVVGLMDLTLDDDRRQAELGYALSPTVWGYGIASEAAKAMVDWGFTKLCLDAIVARALVNNPASCRVLQKTGFRRVGHGTCFMPQRGYTGLFEEYRLLRHEWSGCP